MLWVRAVESQMQASMSKQCRSSPGLGRGRPEVLRRQVHLVSQNLAVDLIQLLLQAADVGVVAGDGSCQRRGQYHLQAWAPGIGSNTQNVPDSLPDLSSKAALQCSFMAVYPGLSLREARAACHMHGAQPLS